jgi:hypothetical protein
MFPHVGAIENYRGRFELNAVVAPGPDSAKSKLLYAVWRAGTFIKGIAAEDHAQILKQPFESRRIEGQTGKFDAVAVDVEDNCLFSRDNQSAQDSKFGSFASKELDDEVGIIQGTGINNHHRHFSGSDLQTGSKFESVSRAVRALSR